MLVINQPKGKLMHCEEDVVLSNAHIKKKDPKGCLASFIVILILITKLASNCSFSEFGVAKQHCQIWKWLFCCCCFLSQSGVLEHQKPCIFPQTCV